MAREYVHAEVDAVSGELRIRVSDRWADDLLWSLRELARERAEFDRPMPGTSHHLLNALASVLEGGGTATHREPDGGVP